MNNKDKNINSRDVVIESIDKSDIDSKLYKGNITTHENDKVSENNKRLAKLNFDNKTALHK